MALEVRIDINPPILGGTGDRDERSQVPTGMRDRSGTTYQHVMEWHSQFTFITTCFWVLPPTSQNLPIWSALSCLCYELCFRNPSFVLCRLCTFPNVKWHWFADLHNTYHISSCKKLLVPVESSFRPQARATAIHERFYLLDELVFVVFFGYLMS